MDTSDYIERLENRLKNLERQYDSLFEKYSDLALNKIQKETQDENINLSKRLEDIVKVVGAILAPIAGTISILYLLGFIIVNVYLASFGIRAFSLARATYISAGILFVITHFIISVFGSILSWIVISLWIKVEERVKKKPGLQHKATFFLIYLVIASIFFFVIFLLGLFAFLHAPTAPVGSMSPFQLTFLIKYESLVVIIIMIMTGILIGMLIRWYINRHVVAGYRELTNLVSLNKFILTCLVLMSPLLLMNTLQMWARSLYPEISPAFGGGAPVVVRLEVFDDKNSNLFTEIGLDVANNLTSPIRLIDNTDETLIILLNNGNAAELDKSLIANILYLSPDNVISTPIPQMTPFFFVTPTSTQP